jgi:methionyl-tRNA synthetase
MVRCGHSLGVALQILRMLAVMMAPVIPFAMEKVWGWLGMEEDLWAEGWAAARVPIPAGRVLGKTEILFPKLDDELIQPEIERLQKMLDD